MMAEYVQQVNDSITEKIHGIHTAIPGKIVKYDPAKVEADILPYGKFRKNNGKWLDYPQLNHVPILFPQSCSQDFRMVYPIKPDDECLILIQEESLDIWRGSGAETENDLKFDLTNAIAIMGLFAKPQTLAKEAQDDDKLIIQKNDHRLHIKPDEVLVKYSDNEFMHFKPGEILLQHDPACHIRMNSAGITITAPVINLEGETEIKESAAMIYLN